MSSSPDPAGAAGLEGHLLVVGAGECGARVATEAYQRGWSGPITLVGAEEGAPYERPPLSKAVLVDPDPEPVEPWRDGRLDLPGLMVRLGERVSALDVGARTATLDGGEVLAWDRLVLATGARSRTLPGLPEGVLTLRSWHDAQAVREVLEKGGHLLVIGAGLIGLEVAASARTRGLEVTVVEAGARVLGRAVPAVTAQRVAERHAEEGVRIVTDVTCSGFTRVDSPSLGVERRDPSTADPSGGWQVTLSTGERLEADAVLVAVGGAPDVELAEAAGLDLAGGGIRVDAQMRTSAPGVWAAGDCCTGPVALAGDHVRLESWRMAHDQAVTAARSLVGEDVTHDAVPWFWSDQYDVTLQVSGLASLATQWVERPVGDTHVELGLDEDGRLVCAAGVGVGASVAREVRLAEKLMVAGAHPDPEALADPAVRLRDLLPR